jgi:predicted nucleic acid-binding protein
MKQVVADASVVVKWVFPSKDDEADADKALNLLTAVKGGQISLYQPPHWLAEVAAVIVRLSPATVLDDVADLYTMEFTVVDTPKVYMIACELSRTLNQHLFDTLYHAVALTLSEAVLVTADERYYRKAQQHGKIGLLANFPDPY